MNELKPNTVLYVFNAKDGREVILRTPRWDDLDDMLDFINSLVKEEAMILMNKEQPRDQEIDWLANKLKRLEKRQCIAVVAEVDGKIVASCEINQKPGRSSHVGSLGISVKKGYREIGIGQELMKKAEKHAIHMGLKMVILEVYAINERAIHVYEKQGYEVCGRITEDIEYKDEYVDSVIMMKKLPSS